MVYRPGMKVRIADKLDYDDPMGVTYEMEVLQGKYATVMRIDRNSVGEFAVLDIDRGEFCWTESMLVPVCINKGRFEPFDRMEGIDQSSCIWKPHIVMTDYQSRLMRRIFER